MAGVVSLAACLSPRAPEFPPGLRGQEPAVALEVRDTAGWRAALAEARPGAVILLAPGVYAGGASLANLRSSQEHPLRIASLDPEHPATVRGGGCGLQLTDVNHVEIADLVFEGQSGNGLNIDDGGTPESASSHVVLRRITVRDVGPRGNCDGIKLSGVVDFRVEDCVVERWGSAGSAIDMVGCRNGVIERSRFEHGPEARNANGVQAKGGSRDIAIRRSRFVDAGSRAINVGGSTGLQFFRPALETWQGPRFEAKDVVVEGNTFLGSDAPIAWVGIDGSRVRFNTIYRPRRWVLRLLQETRAEGFVPARGGVFEDNLVVFAADELRGGGLNVGDGTNPGSLGFARNLWTCVDQPERSRELVRLPSEDAGGRFGLDPQFLDAPAGDLRLAPGSPAAGVGAEALPP
ncbi:MAG: right-handed parallel beta-helix repeat-containing protein [Planctomycetes bacterium]|nr:right-handed parallel beta-helix repeat-containing protein [Planctomycetota bacterium]